MASPENREGQARRYRLCVVEGLRYAQVAADEGVTKQAVFDSVKRFASRHALPLKTRNHAAAT